MNATLALDVLKTKQFSLPQDIMATKKKLIEIVMEQVVMIT